MSLALSLVTFVTGALDGGVVLAEEGFSWTLPEGAQVTSSRDAGVDEGEWGRGAAGRHVMVTLADRSLWQVTRWSVPKLPKGLTAKRVLQQWRTHHACVSTAIDRGEAFSSASLQFAHEGNCMGGDLYARRVAVFAVDGGAVVYELNAGRLLTDGAGAFVDEGNARTDAGPPMPMLPLRTSLDLLVRSLTPR